MAATRSRCYRDRRCAVVSDDRMIMVCARGGKIDHIHRTASAGPRHRLCLALRGLAIPITVKSHKVMPRGQWLGLTDELGSAVVGHQATRLSIRIRRIIKTKLLVVDESPTPDAFSTDASFQGPSPRSNFSRAVRQLPFSASHHTALTSLLFGQDLPAQAGIPSPLGQGLNHDQVTHWSTCPNGNTDSPSTGRARMCKDVSMQV